MTKKKNVKSEDINKTNIGDDAENKDISSQDDNTVNDQTDTEKSLPEGDEAEQESGLIEEDAVQPADKEAAIEDSLELKLSEMQDRYLRLAAEFDNYRKRTLREKIELTKHAGEKYSPDWYRSWTILKELLNRLTRRLIVRL